jgi:hypothetical protein
VKKREISENITESEQADVTEPSKREVTKINKCDNVKQKMHHDNHVMMKTILDYTMKRMRTREREMTENEPKMGSREPN